MKGCLILISGLGVIASAAATPVVIDFEGFPDGLTPLTDQYLSSHVSFEPGNSIISGLYNSTSGPYRTHSGTGLISGGNRVLGRLTDGWTASNFSLWYTARDAGTQVSLFRNNSLVGQSTLGVSTFNAPAAQLSLSGVVFDTFVVNGSPTYFGVDDITFNAVPEPASMAALGFGGLVLIRSRRKVA